MTHNEMLELARGAIERNLGADFEDPESMSEDEIYDDAYTLAFDALHDAGIQDVLARRIANEAATSFAQP